MTKKEYLIDELMKNCSCKDKFLIETIYKIVNDCDWKIFCSYMGDYDHPEERVQAEKEMNMKLEKIIAENPENKVYVDFVKSSLNEKCEIRDFYNANFHSMNEEKR